MVVPIAQPIQISSAVLRRAVSSRTMLETEITAATAAPPQFEVMYGLDGCDAAAADLLRVGAGSFARHLREHRYSAVLDLSDATSEQQMTLLADLATGWVG